MNPGATPVNTEDRTIAELCMGFGVLSKGHEWQLWSIQAIEPIEDET